ncbi:RHS repeat-associated core domain-containing protein [Saccharothrix obliqua]|uniref:RHS repeat-associated core domain-containing protein n=1 Tax=Saccharothrix obliqua TaxID=2861747 RepID=UPI001C606E1C|nr:RHS repeat-associated core domain-containing protein [Saccharothrix obliqua]MBW4719978.1 type IV secretion protein Rhs [Saccharothrix obliqua]
MRSSVRKAIAIGVVTVLTMSTAQAVANAVDEGEWSLPAVQREESVPTTPVTTSGSPDGTSPAAVTTAAGTARPAAAVGEVDLGRGGTAAQAAARAAGTPLRVAGTPVAVGLATEDRSLARQATGKVRVEVHGDEVSSSAVVFSLADAGGAQDKPLRVTFDYGTLTGIGGDYGSRLRLVGLPACAVTTPDKPECRVETPVAGAGNDTRAKSLSGVVTLRPAEPAVLAAVASVGSDVGTYGATSLAPAGSWSAGGSSGDFTYGYPMRVPPAIGGGAPSVSLGYSAQSLDGRTSATNNQASWAGDGWDISPGGFIERQYKPCGLDLGGNNGQTKTGDQCWATDNATVSLAGVSGKLVNIPGTRTYRVQNDDGARVERLTGAANGDDDGEHWKVTTIDGTQYFLGLNRLPGWTEGKPETQSAWTVPVYGNNSGEPCNAGTFDASWCQQAYRWNLDYSVDTRGNVTTYYYNREFNHYGRNADPAKGTPYVRGGWLDRVEYGLREGAVFAHPGAKVVFETAERCVPSGAVTCDPGQLNASTAGSWPDVPFDQVCGSGEQCTNRLTPSHFTRKKLTKVVTYVATGASSVKAVDSWTLNHQFLATGDGLAPSLNLESVVHTGLVGGSIALPPTKFAYTAKANRVDTSVNYRALTRHRLHKITNEAGGETEVNYSEADCVPGSRMPTAPESNAFRCFPTWWTPDGALQPRFEWFHKYVVLGVVDTDVTGASTRIPTAYEYLGDPAWHFDEADFADPERRTWSQWRGYGVVRTKKGDGEAGPQTVTETVYGRGMDGDKLPSGTREAWIHTSEGEPVRDVDRLRGYVRETRQYNNGALASASVHDPYLPDQPTATDALGNKAFVNGDASVRGRTLLENGTWRRTRVDKQFNAEGIAVRVEDHGDLAVTGDETCTRTTYARNETAWILGAASTVETVVGTCAVTASASTIQSLARSYYDGQAHGVAPTKGLITKAEALDKWDASGQSWVTASTSTYDAYGRPLEVTDARGEKTTTAYTPETGPLTQLTSTNPLGHVSKSFIEPAWGASTASVDPNNRRSDLSFDALGRMTAAWLPGRDKATKSADALFEYHYNTNKPVVVVTKQRQDNGNYLAGYTLYDGLFRQRQTQVPAPGADGGRQVSDTFYDSRGLPYKTNGTHWNSAAAGGELAASLDAQIPGQTRTEYDGMERPTAAVFYKLGVEQWRTTTRYGGDRVHTTPPRGAPATTIVNDAQGRTLEKRQYTNGLGSAYDTTSYAYDNAGLLTTLTDPAGNVWRYSYDLRGRVVATDDPDAGHSTSTYDVAGQVLSTTDAQGRTIVNTYDKLGRVVGRYQGSTAGTKLAEWEYDTAPGGGLGLLRASRRFDNGGTYTRSVVGYDAAGRPTGARIVVPTATEGALGATYQVEYDYTSTGKQSGLTYLAANSGSTQIYGMEFIGSYYNTANGLLEVTNSNLATYVSQTTYSSFGETLQWVNGRTDGNVEKNVSVTNTYAIGTRRLERNIVARETSTGSVLSDRNYTYDAAGNILKIADTPDGRPADIQCFAYDHLRRMTDAWTPSSADCGAAKSTAALGGPAPYWHSWTFDKTGNRLTETQHAAAGDTVRTTAYPAAGAAQPHTALSVTTAGPNGTSLDTFAYDPTGRTTSRKIGGDEQKLEYDAEGRISKIIEPDGKESKYLYDADGNRLISREPSATTVYAFGQEIRLETGTTKPSWTRWYSHGEQVVAVRNSIAGLKWLAGDHQGTNQYAITQNTMEFAQRRQTPYGAPRGDASPWPDKLGFVGGRNDESGLTNVGARLYDPASGRFLSADPVVDNNDPQQLNGYAYANNSPVTFSDPTGLLRNCGPDGVLCGGYRPGIHGGDRAAWEREHAYYSWRERVVQQQKRETVAATQRMLQDEGISQEEYEKALSDAHKTKWDVIKEVAWEVIKDISGWNDIVDCFTKGDIWGCFGVVTGLVPWGKALKIVEAGVNAIKAVSRLASIVDKAWGVLRRVQGIAENAAKAVTEKFQKLIAAGSGCVPGKHSFVAGTQVVMADGSTKPISEVELGDRVKATDPVTKETTERAVVATIVHDDEGDMTELTVTGEGGAGGTVDATSWHPVWVDAEGRFVDIGELAVGQRLTSPDGTSPVVSGVQRETRFEPVYNLTVEGVHTYYVLAGTVPFLVHNCGGTATIFFDPQQGASGHAIIRVDLADGRSRTTEQFISGVPSGPGDYSGLPTTGALASVDDLGPRTVGRTFDLPDAAGAWKAQRATIGTDLGGYDQLHNNCVTYCTDILRAGGVSIPQGAVGVSMLRRAMRRG